MQYIKSKKYDTPLIRGKSMGPKPLKFQEELLNNHKIPHGAPVLDLGSGQGITSVFLAKEYGFKVYAVDLWSNPEENQAFFGEMGLTKDQIVAEKADASALPFENDFFDAVISTDSYNYFGRDPDYLDSRLLPFMKRGAYLYIAIPGMKRDAMKTRRGSCFFHGTLNSLLSCATLNTG
jgi:cyclopropane fatty-acyl-phospholipid synthase-like methyltransferase